MLATKFYNNKSPINIGSGRQTSIKELVYLIKEIMKFKGEIKWDTTKVVGQKFNQ